MITILAIMFVFMLISASIVCIIMHINKSYVVRKLDYLQNNSWIGIPVIIIIFIFILLLLKFGIEHFSQIVLLNFSGEFSFIIAFFFTSFIMLEFSLAMEHRKTDCEESIRVKYETDFKNMKNQSSNKIIGYKMLLNEYRERMEEIDGSPLKLDRYESAMCWEAICNIQDELKLIK